MSSDAAPDIAEEFTAPKQGRKGDGGTYLVVADDSEEFATALRYACFAAKSHRGRLGILHIIEDQDFQHWGTVEGRIKKELREKAEQYLWTIAKTANDLNGTIPSLYVAEGEPGEALTKTIDADNHIVQLILGGKSGSAPGPLVSFCIGKGLERMKVPVVVVPSHIKEFS
ncbi:MAG: universal stress protein [Micavibrio aeruginosavorus]|uniref:Universal stress protein n=1 Tax=Micavibrio aeruginosavorus TaxID=349221 RepID=A0A2W5MW53_9BACT|nr:MAG: universal stress protein [Micavibrio aeruginosavorus]